MPLDTLRREVESLPEALVASHATSETGARDALCDLMLKILSRDDQLRREYVQRRWHTAQYGRARPWPPHRTLTRRSSPP
jgi:hypothetical protein